MGTKFKIEPSCYRASQFIGFGSGFTFGRSHQRPSYLAIRSVVGPTR